MKQTRFMQVMFSAVENSDEELAAQVAGDIEAAKENGNVDTDEVSYINLGEGKVMIVDKGNGEATIAQMAEDEADTYDLIAVPDEELEKYLHPEKDGVTPNSKVKTEKHEDHKEHMTGKDVISPNMSCGGLNPKAGSEQRVDDTVKQCSCEEEEEKEFSVKTDNSTVLRIFSDQLFCERLFSEVIESEQTSVVGNLKVEKCSDEPDSIIVTDINTGDQAKVKFDDDNMEVTELDQKEFKNFSEDEQYEPLFVVGIDPVENIMVDAPVYTEEDGEVLAKRLEEIGVEGVQVFDDPDKAREYASDLLGEVGVNKVEQLEEPETKEFSDTIVYVTRYYSDVTNFMIRLYSEVENEITDSQDEIEDAIESGEQVEDDEKIITPVDSETAVVEDKDNGEFTKVTLEDKEINLEKIDEKEASKLMEDLQIEEKEDDDDEDKEEEKDFSDVTNFMIRLYSEAEDEITDSQDEIEDAIESGEQVEDDEKIITPVDSETAVVEDKDNGEFTKVTLEDKEINLEKIDEKEASKLMEDLQIEEKEDDDDEDKEEEKDFSDVTNFIVRLFSDNEDGCDCQEKVEDAIESGEQIEDDDKVITPVDAKTAVIEDKDNDEFTKVTIEDDELHAQKITEEEAESLTEDLKIENNEFSNLTDTLCKFFASVQNNESEEDNENKTTSKSVEVVEDKALAAVQAIQEATDEAVQAIQEAKETPAPGGNEDLKEARFSEVNSNSSVVGTLESWLSFYSRKKNNY